MSRDEHQQSSFSGNIAARFERTALERGDVPAIYVTESVENGKAKYRSLTYRELNALSNRYANALLFLGVRRGMKCLIMLRPGFDFIATVFAAFKLGAVPVLIDPGMGRKNLLNCVADTRPDVLIAIPMVHWARFIWSRPFRGVKISVGLKGSPFWIPRLETFRESGGGEHFKTVETAPDEMAAILFTTGCTGAPKGAVYTHAIFNRQTDVIRETYEAGPEHIDMPAFPLFALFSAALGMPCVIPDIDPSRPADADPETLIRTIRDHNVSFSFASPALWKRLSAYCHQRDIQLPSLRKVLMAGAPVTAELHQKLKFMISRSGETYVPYGATEALPIANFTGAEALTETADLTAKGAGYCVGYPLGNVSIRVIRATGEAIDNWDRRLEIPDGQIGEIVVKGPVVTPAYYDKPLATSYAKIRDRDGAIWHRMGDMGYFDAKGRLWFCGRKAHVVSTEQGPMHSVCCEAIFNRHPAVARSALIGLSRKKDEFQEPVMVIEPIPGMMPKDKEEEETFVRELLHIGKAHADTARIQRFLFHPAFPVDVRHNAKIFREELAAWAKKKLK